MNVRRILVFVATSVRIYREDLNVYVLQDKLDLLTADHVLVRTFLKCCKTICNSAYRKCSFNNIS